MTTRRGLGPFSGGQLTAIVITAILALGLPAGALATGAVSKTVLTNSTGTAKAGVVGGRLRVSALVTGPVSAKLTSPVSVGGTVTTRLADPTSYFHATKFGVIGPPSGCAEVAIFTAPAHQAVILTQLSVDVYHLGAVQDLVTITTATACNPNGWVDEVAPATVGRTPIQFSPGLPVPAGASVYAYVSGNGTSADIFATGFTVPASAVPAAHH